MFNPSAIDLDTGLPEEIPVKTDGIRLLESPLGANEKFETEWCTKLVSGLSNDSEAIEEFGRKYP